MFGLGLGGNVSMSRLGLYFRFLAAVAILVPCACESDEWSVLFNTASLGGSVPGERGTVTIGFVNDTDYSAVFVYGVYDPLDSQGEYTVFDEYTLEAGENLVGHTSTPVAAFPCARTMAVGTAEFIDAMKVRGFDTGADPLALGYGGAVGGVYFYDAKVGEPKPDKPVGRAEGVSVLQGHEFPCTRAPATPDAPPEASLVLFTFRQDASGFHVDYAVFPAE